MKNKKGFTLIELLAVIVILAIIMVIAIPQILNVINNSRAASWSNNVKIIKNAIETTTSTSSVGIGNHTVKSLCNNNETSNDIDVTNKIGEIVKLKNTNIKCKKDGNYIFGLTGTNNFNGMSATITCTSESKCSIDISSSEPVNIPDPVSFSTDSWATIAANTTSSVYQVGDTKTIQIDMDIDGTPESYTIRIANTSTPEVCNTEGYSQTACGFVLEFVNSVEYRIMDPERTNAGGWKETEMVTHLNSDFYNKLPEDLRNVIIPTYPIVSGSGNNQTSENITASDTTKNKIYLLSAKEVGLNHTYDNKKDELTDTRTLDYYNLHTSNSDRSKKNSSNNYVEWWLRTAKAINNTDFDYVSGGGGIGGYDANKYALMVTPAFRIGN